MRISNITSIMRTRTGQINNNTNDKGTDSSRNYNRDATSISKSGKNAFQKQSKAGSFIEALLKQKQNIIDSKNSLIERTMENGQALDSVKDQLEMYEEQINSIDKQIAEYNLKEQQKKIGVDKKEKNISQNEPKTHQESKNKQLNNIIALSSDISQIEMMTSIKNKMKAQSTILTKEIKLDESRSVSGQKAVHKRELLEKSKERISDIDKKVQESLQDINEKIKDINEKIKDNTNDEKNAIFEKSEKVSIEYSSMIAAYKDMEDSLKDTPEKPQLQKLA